MSADAGSEPAWRSAWKAGKIRAVSPTVLQSGPYRFFFFSSDRGEPVHIHVARERKAAKFWLAPVRREYNRGFGAAELNKITALIHEHEADFVKAWHDYFQSGN